MILLCLSRANDLAKWYSACHFDVVVFVRPAINQDGADCHGLECIWNVQKKIPTQSNGQTKNRTHVRGSAGGRAKLSLLCPGRRASMTYSWIDVSIDYTYRQWEKVLNEKKKLKLIENLYETRNKQAKHVRMIDSRRLIKTFALVWFCSLDERKRNRSILPTFALIVCLSLCVCDGTTPARATEKTCIRLNVIDCCFCLPNTIQS